MKTANRPASGKPASRLRRALDCCLRLLTPPPADQPDAGPSFPVHQQELNRLGQRFSNDLFARLLLELPAHRRSLDVAHKAADCRRLRENVHQLLGATAYCDAPELEAGLRELRQALHSGDGDSIDRHVQRTIYLIDNTLRCSGCSGS